MATEIRVPNLGESIVEATVGQWFKQAGDAVSAAEPLVEESQTLAAPIWSAMRAVLRYRNLKLFCCIAPKRRVVI